MKEHVSLAKFKCEFNNFDVYDKKMALITIRSVIKLQKIIYIAKTPHNSAVNHVVKRRQSSAIKVTSEKIINFVDEEE